MTAMTDEKRVSDRLYVFAKILANNEWTAALLGAYNPDGSIEVPYEAAKAALVADLTALSRRSQEPDGWRLVPVEPTKEMVDAGLKRNTQNPHPWCPAVYRAMLAAAPIPQSNEAK